MIKKRNFIQGIIMFFAALFVLIFKPGWHDMRNEMRISMTIVIGISLAIIVLYRKQKKNDRNETKN